MTKSPGISTVASMGLSMTDGDGQYDMLSRSPKEWPAVKVYAIDWSRTLASTRAEQIVPVNKSTHGCVPRRRILLE